MARKAAMTPGAGSTRKIDFAGHALAKPPGSIGGDDFTCKLMPGGACELIVAALQFEVGIANAGTRYAHKRETRRPCGQGGNADRNQSVFQVNSLHDSR
jgi:hypothetical protein